MTRITEEQRCWFDERVAIIAEGEKTTQEEAEQIAIEGINNILQLKGLPQLTVKDFKDRYESKEQTHRTHDLC